MIEEKCEDYHLMNNCSIYVTYFNDLIIYGSVYGPS